MAKKAVRILEPNPFQSLRSMNAIIYVNVLQAQKHVGRPLTVQEIKNLIKRMKERKLFKSKQDSATLYGTFRSTLLTHKRIEDAEI